MQIILDIDGVLVSGAGWKIPQLLEDGFADQWKKIFERRGIHVEKLSLLASNHNSRKEEILEWFNKHHIIEDFVIIDDDATLNGLPDHLKKHVVFTSPLIGLTPEHLFVIKAIAGDRN